MTAHELRREIVVHAKYWTKEKLNAKLNILIAVAAKHNKAIIENVKPQSLCKKIEKPNIRTEIKNKTAYQVAMKIINFAYYSEVYQSVDILLEDPSMAVYSEFMSICEAYGDNIIFNDQGGFFVKDMVRNEIMIEE